MEMIERMKEVAARLRELREVTEVSLEEMCAVTGLSEADYLAYESGEKDFSFNIIFKCAQRFGVDIADIILGSSPKLSTYSLVRKGDGAPIARRRGFSYKNVAPMFKGKMAEPFYVVAPYSEEEQSKPIEVSSHAGQEMDIILKGALRVSVDGHEEVAREGDVLYYDSSTPHGMIATEGADCEFIAVILPPHGEEAVYPEESPQIPKKSAHKHGDVAVCSARFIETTEDENGNLKAIKFKNDDKFNFAFDIVDDIAARKPDKLAMMYLDREKKERRFTFSDMSRLSSKAANYFASLGIKRGDRVMLILKRNWQFWVSILACHKLGAIAIPATNMLVRHDLEYRFNAAGVSAIVCTADGDVSHQVDLAEPQSETLNLKILVGASRDGWHDFNAEFEKCSDLFPRTEDSPCGRDPMVMFFSSGTTGYPKIACHDYRYALGHFVTARYWHNVDPDGIHFTISDTGWGKALWGKLYGQWMCEAATFTYDFDKFSAEDLLPLFKKYNITTFCAPPTMYRFFIREDLSKYDLSSLEYATIAGEALNPEVFWQFYKATGLKIMEGFGQTETTLTIGNLIGMEPKPGSMGKPTPQYDVHILRPDGTECDVAETGEICINTENGAPCGLYCGYYRDREKTDEVWHDGFYHTGDTAWRDEDGYFWYVGRVDDLIKSSGYRIGPFEIESVLMELPYVLECAVTAAPDPIRGQVVKATIVLTKGTVGTDELKKEIQNYVKTHTAPYKYPRIVDFVDELPKTISGKIKRTEIRARDNK